MYHCLDCDKDILVRRKRQHDKRHDPYGGLYVCRICEIEGKEYPPCVLLSSTSKNQRRFSD